MTPAVYTIDADQPFAHRLAGHILDQLGRDPMALSSALILIPTQRGRYPLETAFMQLLGGDAGLLPAIYPLADVADLAEGLSLGLIGGLAGKAAAGDDSDSSDTLGWMSQPAISETGRRVVLAQLIRRWSDMDPGGGAARQPLADVQVWRLAAQLGSFFDDMIRHGVDAAAVRNLAPDEHASHWQRIIGFLEIVLALWPDILAERGLVDQVTLQEQALAALARAVDSGQLDRPVFAAGSTGSRPAVRTLLRAVAGHPQGQVILPGLDSDMADPLWDDLPAQHPQAPLKRLINHMGVSRHEVQTISPPAPPAPVSTADTGPRAPAERLSLLQDAMAPAPATADWSRSPWRGTPAAAGLAGLRVVVAANRREEADVIALAMREALETPGRTAALVTPDRSLAEYVRMALADWGISVDDSAGVAARLTVPGRLLLLLGDALGGDGSQSLSPVKLLALLNHPLVHLGTTRERARRFARKLDRLALRGPRPAGGLAAIGALLENPEKFDADDAALWAYFLQQVRPLIDLLAGEATPAALLRAHIAAAEGLCRDHPDGDADPQAGNALWAQDAGRAIAVHLSALLDDLDGAAPLQGAGWPALFEALLDDVSVRPGYIEHPRLKILGQLEARMQWADLMILGGVYDGSWPAEPPADPWLNRRMRASLGLPPVEDRQALAAHDFIQAAAAPDVLITWPEKIDGTPVVPSRFIYRLQALVGGPLPQAPELLAWARQRRSKGDSGSRRTSRTSATPPLEARPKKLAVTDIQRLMEDPYALYAKKILRLRPLEPIDQNPSAAQKGTVLHKALEDWIKATADKPQQRLTDAGRQLLIQAGEQAFAPIAAYPGIHAFWWPRFMQMVDQVIAHGANWWAEHRTLAVEVRGQWAIPGLDFTVEAEADRIDQHADGGLVIIDYKTGNIPTKALVELGYRPQLPLEAVIAEAGGFLGVPAADVREFAFWHITGSDKGIDLKRYRDPRATIDEAADGVARLIRYFAQADSAYISKPRRAVSGFGDYDHLARVAQWRGMPLAPSGGGGS